MARDRNNFCNTTRSRLVGAFGEYMCREIALAIGEPDSWSNEVRRLTKQVTVLMDVSEVVTFKDKDKAFREALKEAASSQEKITYAKNKVEKYYPKKRKAILHLEYDVEQEFPKMMNEFLPQFAHLLVV